MTDSFKEQLQQIADDTKDRLEREKQHREEREKQFRENVKSAFQTADAFNNRVITPILTEFAADAPGVSEYKCEFNESDSQPEFVHSCKLYDQRFAVSFLYWIAGSARICCGFGYAINGDEFKIESFDESDLDGRVDSWLRSNLLEKYKSFMDRTHHLNEPKDD